MAMDPQKKSALTMFTDAAKAVVYDAGRMEQFLPLMETRDGAVKAVQSIYSVIHQKRPVPPEIATLLGANIYMLLVDMAREGTGVEPDPETVKGTLDQVMSSMQPGPEQAPPEQMPPEAPPQMPPQMPPQAGTGLMGQRG